MVCGPMGGAVARIRCDSFFRLHVSARQEMRNKALVSPSRDGRKVDRQLTKLSLMSLILDAVGPIQA